MVTELLGRAVNSLLNGSVDAQLIHMIEDANKADALDEKKRPSYTRMNFEAFYLEKVLGITFDKIPQVNQDVRPGFILSGTRYCPHFDIISETVNIVKKPRDKEEPTPIERFIEGCHENGHAYFIQQRPDIRVQYLNLVKRLSFEKKQVDEYIRMCIFDEGFAHYCHYIAGRKYASSRNDAEAEATLRAEMEVLPYRSDLMANNKTPPSKEGYRAVIHKVLEQSEDQILSGQDKGIQDCLQAIRNISAQLLKEPKENEIPLLTYKRLNKFLYHKMKAIGFYYWDREIKRLEVQGQTKAQAINALIHVPLPTLEEFAKKREVK